MKLSKQQKESVKQCVKDLEYYYETCGNNIDFENLEVLKIHLNTIEIGVPYIEAHAIEVFKDGEKKFSTDDDFNVFNPMYLTDKD